MAKKFFLISQVFYPDEVSTASLFTDLCSVLAEDGTEVEVWSAQPSYTVLGRQPSKLEYKGIHILFLPSTNFQKNSLPGRVLNILTFTISASLKVLFSSHKTPIWTHTTPPFLGIIISFICSLKKIKFVYILLDIFPEGLIRLGNVSGNNPFIKLWNWLFIRSLTKSKRIVVIGRDIESWVNEKCKKCQNNIEYIPHWQSDKRIFPIEFEKNEFVREHGLKSKFVVQYSGNMGLWNELETIGKVVKKNIDNVEFIFVGGGIRKKELLNEFSPEEQENVMMLPFQANDNFNNILNASHVHLVTLKEGLEGIAVPCKIYGILGAGRPVIAMVPADSEIAYIVKEENCGFVLNPADLDGLVNTICLLKSDETLTKQMGLNSRKAFDKKYSTGIVAERYKSILNQLLA